MARRRKPDVSELLDRTAERLLPAGVNQVPVSGIDTPVAGEFQAVFVEQPVTLVLVNKHEAAAPYTGG